MIHFNSSKLPPADSVRDEEQIIPDVQSAEDVMRREDNVINAQDAFDPYGYGLTGQPVQMPIWTWLMLGAVFGGIILILALRGIR